MNSHNFNPNSYKQYLSPFGKNVLDTLVKHWRTEIESAPLKRHNNDNRHRRQFDFESNKRNASFRDSRNSPCLITPVTSSPDIPNHGIDIFQAPSHETFPVPPRRIIPEKRRTLTFIKEALPVNLPQHGHIDGLPNAHIPSSVELVKTVANTDLNDNLDDEILTANYMITPAIEFTKKTYDFISNRKDNDALDDANIPPIKFLEILNHESNVESPDKVITTEVKYIEKKDVNWCEIFDTELFAELKDSTNITKKPEEKDQTKTFLIQFPSEKDKKGNAKEVEVSRAMNVIKSNFTEKKAVTRKNQTKITDSVAKKVKKSKHIVKELNMENIPKTNTRKVKYTTVIKNWLDDVDANKEVEEEKTDNATAVAEKSNVVPKLEPTKKVHDNTKDVTEKNTDKAKNKSKKVVQARLAQKDGKMKFGVPTKEQNEHKPGLIDNKTENKDTINDKKLKPKFVPPIKSQIPVKNITFDVRVMDGNDFKMMDILETASNEIIMILVYANGFSQLNNHNTDDTCIPEGIMIQLNNCYIYLKGVTKELGKIIMDLIQKCDVICYNGKQLLIHLKSQFNIELMQGSFDIRDAKIGGSLIDPDNPPENFSELQKLLGFTPEFTIATECVLQKAAWYVTLLRECFARLKALLVENSVWNVFVDIEMRLLPIIAGMEYRGVSVDLDKLKCMEDILLTKMKAVEQECYKVAGKTFQINSTLQVRTILYDELQLDTKSNLKIKETIGIGAKSTSEIMLRGLIPIHPLPKLILEYRHLHKAHATFLTGIAQHVKNGLVKPTWVQTAAATGRISSNNPNLQAIPKAPFNLDMFSNDTADQVPLLKFRSVYGARAGRCLLAADFKHIECRVFAHVAGDAALLAALATGRDLFRVLAAKWLCKPEAEVSSEDRERTKRIVYASLYGAGARKLMEILQIGYEQALTVSSSFNRTFPALKAFGRAVVARAGDGALSSLGGRARRFRDIASADAARRAHAERQAVNFVVQGSAADLCKLAMVQVEQRLQTGSPPLGAHLVLQIHDELVWEVDQEDLDQAAAIIKEVMENIGRQCGMNMTLPVEMSCGQNWGEMHYYSPKSHGA